MWWELNTLGFQGKSGKRDGKSDQGETNLVRLVDFLKEI